MATNFRVKIGKIGLLTFIFRPDIKKRSGISQFLIFKDSMAMIWLHHVKFDELWSNNSRV